MPGPLTLLCRACILRQSHGLCLRIPGLGFSIGLAICEIHLPDRAGGRKKGPLTAWDYQRQASVV